MNNFDFNYTSSIYAKKNSPEIKGFDFKLEDK